MLRALCNCGSVLFAREKFQVFYEKDNFCEKKPSYSLCIKVIELPHDKTSKMVCVPSKDSDQPGHLPSLIRVFTVHSVGSWAPNVSSCGQQILWSDWVDGRPGWSESSLGAKIILLVLSWGGSFFFSQWQSELVTIPFKYMQPRSLSSCTLPSVERPWIQWTSVHGQCPPGILEQGSMHSVHWVN